VVATQLGTCAVVHLVLAPEAPTYRGTCTHRVEMVNIQAPQKRRPVPPANNDALRSDHGRDLC